MQTSNRFSVLGGCTGLVDVSDLNCWFFLLVCIVCLSIQAFHLFNLSTDV